ncbi:hypothetical protein [Cysteiniphilum litorale]|uniref:hypothetical protein n=1 Tax=Cysteiniphilum litorale TaxID=2056700 RepID=UPI003F88435E
MKIDDQKDLYTQTQTTNDNSALLFNLHARQGFDQYFQLVNPDKENTSCKELPKANIAHKKQANTQAEAILSTKKPLTFTSKNASLRFATQLLKTKQSIIPPEHTLLKTHDNTGNTDSYIASQPIKADSLKPKLEKIEQINKNLLALLNDQTPHSHAHISKNQLDLSVRTQANITDNMLKKLKRHIAINTKEMGLQPRHIHINGQLINFINSIQIED